MWLVQPSPVVTQDDIQHRDPTEARATLPEDFSACRVLFRTTWVLNKLFLTIQTEERNKQEEPHTLGGHIPHFDKELLKNVGVWEKGPSGGMDSGSLLRFPKSHIVTAPQ